MRANDTQRLLTINDLAGLLQVPEQTLYKWRSHGDGPPGFRVGKHVRYKRADVDAWIDSLQERER